MRNISAPFTPMSAAVTLAPISLSSLAGTAGGLTNLAKMPACNVLVVGAAKKTLSGFSQANILPHTGYIYYTDLVQSVPPVSYSSAFALRAGPSFLGPHAMRNHPDIVTNHIIFGRNVFSIVSVSCQKRREHSGRAKISQLQ